MFKTITMISIIFSSITFMNLNHPMLIVMMIIIQTILLCSFLWISKSISWFSYILFLVMLGALMILFIYICSLASNEMINFKIKLNKILWLLILPLVSMTIMHMEEQNLPQYQILSKMITSSTNILSIMSMIFLLITLIVVVKIVKYKFSALRSKKN